MGSTIVKTEIVSWEKSLGDKVNKGDIVYITKSDKAEIDIESFNEGYLAAILAEAGEVIPLGYAIGLIAETKAEIPLAQQQAKEIIAQRILAQGEISSINSDRANDSNREHHGIKRPPLPIIPSFRLTQTIETNTFENFYIANKLKGLTMTGLLVKLVAQTLSKHPQLNCYVAESGIENSPRIDINISVFLTGGKTVFPTLFYIEEKKLQDLSIECLQLADRVINNLLKPNEYSRGNITIVNMGMLNVDYFDSALFAGQSFTIAFAASKNKVTTLGDRLHKFKVTKQMKVNFIGDSRIFSPEMGRNFLQDLALLIEDKVLLSQLI